MQEEQIRSLEKINEVLLQKLMKMLHPQYVWVDFDNWNLIKDMKL